MGRTLRDEVMTMAAPLHKDSAFDPLVDLAGLWTTALAERYLPLPELPPAYYECEEGRLVMSPREGNPNNWASGRMLLLLVAAAEPAGYLVYSSINMRFSDRTWLEPDMAVLRKQPDDLTWTEAEDVLIHIEFVSPGSRRRDRIDKPALCARAGVPYYMLIEVDRKRVVVELHRLVGEAYEEVARAADGERFVTDVPFPLDFDPEVLLERHTRR